MIDKNLLDILEKEWRGGVLLNPFEVINKAVKAANPFKSKHNFRYAKYALPVCEDIAELFLDCTDYLASHQDESVREVEKNFLTAMFLYLHAEAPPDEQSLCMVCELIWAGDPPAGENYQSDLDRLFKLLEDRNGEHSALVQYRAFQESGSVRKAVMKSINRRFHPLISVTSSDEDNIFDECCGKFELFELASALVHNCGASPEEPQTVYGMVNEIIFVTVALAYMMWELDVTEHNTNKLFEILKKPKIYAPEITLALKAAPPDAFPELQGVLAYWREHSGKAIAAGNFKKAKLYAIEKFYGGYK